MNHKRLCSTLLLAAFSIAACDSPRINTDSTTAHSAQSAQSAAAKPLEFADFGHKKVGVTCVRDACGKSSAPHEFKRIDRGVYVECVGLSINDGIASWIGVDLGRKELIEIQRFAGQRIGWAPKVETTASEFRREIKNEKWHWIEIVCRRELSDSALAEIVARANELWAAKRLLPRLSSDVFYELRLVDGQAVKLVGGMGSLPEQAEQLHALLRSMRAPEWKR
ncbi:MAG: hypothetical protein ABI589_11605 [Burkholderiales bacterium]